MSNNIGDKIEVKSVGLLLTEARTEIDRLKETRAKMRGEISELLAASDADTMLMRNMDRELTRTKASLGRAVEAVEADQTLWQAANACDLCDPLVGLYCEEKHQAEFDRVDQLIRAVLSDPNGEKANAQWVARGEVAQKAVAYLESQDKNLMAAIVTVGGGQKKEAKIRALEMQACREALQDALRRLEEVQNG